jgi:RNA polymerase sigma-70 factor (ECF subfamily)
MKKIDDFYYDIDKYLVEMLKLGDNRAFSVLYDKYWDVLYKITIRKTSSREAAEELIQDLFMSLWVRRHSLQIEKSFQVYIFSAIKYLIINHKKSEVIKRKHRENIPNVISMSVVEEEVSYKELNQAFEREVKKMPSKYQNVFLMRKSEGLSFKEISQKLEIPLSTVEKHMSKAKNMLRNNLREYAASLIFLSQYFSYN